LGSAQGSIFLLINDDQIPELKLCQPEEKVMHAVNGEETSGVPIQEAKKLGPAYPSLFENSVLFFLCLSISPPGGSITVFLQSMPLSPVRIELPDI
jgi:hypothetical protein